MAPPRGGPWADVCAGQACPGRPRDCLSVTRVDGWTVCAMPVVYSTDVYNADVRSWWRGCSWISQVACVFHTPYTIIARCNLPVVSLLLLIWSYWELLERVLRSLTDASSSFETELCRRCLSHVRISWVTVVATAKLSHRLDSLLFKLTVIWS